jgi:hypothetical protein
MKKTIKKRERAREDPKKRGVTNLKPERRTTKEKQTK